ncbi:MAG: hypothetical protein MJE77_40865 [Proteobacteria bacterium]|nr:hypothetical protein [Pseudomonadota bacterium]
MDESTLMSPSQNIPKGSGVKAAKGEVVAATQLGDEIAAHLDIGRIRPPGMLRPHGLFVVVFAQKDPQIDDRCHKLVSGNSADKDLAQQDPQRRYEVPGDGPARGLPAPFENRL